MHEFDQRDREILHALQTEIPLASTPFAIIGQMIDMSEKEVIKRVLRLKQNGVITQIRAMFDGRSLGYRTSLVAATIDPSKIDDAASIINQHPGVSQNYQRNHEFNLWFTVSVPPDSRLGLEKTVDLLGEDAGCETILPLPALKLYRSTPDQEDDGTDDQAENFDGRSSEVDLGDLDRTCIVALQEDLPIQPRPFDALARKWSLSAEDLLEAAERFRKEQKMRRYAAVIQSRRASFSTSALGVWIVPPDRCEEVGRQMASHKGVSQCTLRPVFAEWPYNVFTVVHGRSVDECEGVISALSGDTGVADMRTLFPMREFKRTRITLFTSEVEEWERKRSPQVTTSAAS